MRSYWNIETAPIVTPAALTAVAEAALRLLDNGSGPAGSDADPGPSIWSVEETSSTSVPLVVTCSGPGLPATIPAEIIRPAEIGKHLGWLGSYRLKVKAPLLVLDLYWRPGEPMRIMTLAGGDWEQALLQLADARG